MRETSPQVNSKKSKTAKATLEKILTFLGLLLLALIIWPTNLGGYFQLTVVNGKSMQPTYYSGDVVISIRQTEYEKGDVIVYHPKTLECSRCNVVHRITGGSTKAGWLTQGDNNENYDGWRPKNDEIAGSVLLHLPTAPIASILFSKWLWIGLLSVTINIACIRLLLTDEKTEELSEQITEEGKANEN